MISMCFLRSLFFGGVGWEGVWGEGRLVGFAIFSRVCRTSIWSLEYPGSILGHLRTETGFLALFWS